MNHVVTMGYGDPPGADWVNVVVNGVPVARFTFASSRVTAPARTEFTMPATTFRLVMNEVSTWQARLQNTYGLPMTTVTQRKLTITHQPDGDVAMNGNLSGFAFKTVHKAATLDIILRDRDAFDLSWGEFTWFIHIHSIWMDQVASRG